MQRQRKSTADLAWSLRGGGQRREQVRMDRQASVVQEEKSIESEIFCVWALRHRLRARVHDRIVKRRSPDD